MTPEERKRVLAMLDRIDRGSRGGHQSFLSTVAEKTAEVIGGVGESLGSFSKRFFQASQITTDDAQTAIELIKAGQSHNVSEMNIKMDKRAAMELGGKIPDVLVSGGVDLTFSVQDESHMVVHVKYK